MCIICFLKNEKQYLLRHSAMIRSDRLEHSLENYKNEFINNFINSIDIICDNHNNEGNKFIQKALKTISINDINNLFSVIKDIYIHWINAEVSNAIKKMKRLVSQFRSNSFEESLNSKLLFRGRKSESFISHWDMFHIPFNRRFLIENQRYSLIGQPILYFSSSPYGVYKELGSFENLRLSSFMINSKNSFRIFENINKFESYIIENNNETINNRTEDMVNVEELEQTQFVVSMFLSMILSSCCSFSRREDTITSSFSEEYIIPQILTIVLKQMKYDGVKYTSTKLHTDISEVKANRIFNTLYNNYCIFTNYTAKQSIDKTYVYDKSLYRKLDVSNPISYEEKIDNKFYCIEDSIWLVQNIDEMDNIEEVNRNILYEIGNTLNILKNFLKELNIDTCFSDKKSQISDEKDAIELTNKITEDLTGSYIDRVEEKKVLHKFVNMHILFIRNILLDIQKNKEV